MDFPLKKNDRLITMQFSFPNIDAVPIGLRSMKNEDEAMAAKRSALKHTSPSNDLLKGIYPEKTNLSELPVCIHKLGYVLAVAKYQSRRDQKDKSKFYHMVRFIFVKKEYEDLTDKELVKFKPNRGLALAELQAISSIALWRVRLFRNVYYKDGNPTNDHAISINLEARTPLFERNNPILAVQPAVSPEHEILIRNNSILINKLV